MRETSFEKFPSNSLQELANKLLNCILRLVDIRKGLFFYTAKSVELSAPTDLDANGPPRTSVPTMLFHLKIYTLHSPEILLGFASHCFAVRLRPLVSF